MEIVFGVPQGSILGPLLFIIFLADWFFIVNSMVVENYADDSTQYATANHKDSLMVSLEEASKSFFIWFDNNSSIICSYLAHLLSLSPKNLKKSTLPHPPPPSKKNSYTPGKWNFLILTLKNFLYFLKRKVFLYFGKPKRPKKSLCFRKSIFFTFQETETLRNFLYFRK